MAPTANARTGGSPSSAAAVQNCVPYSPANALPPDILAHLVGHPVAEGLEVPPAGGKRQFVHLGAGVVDVVFAGHPVARLPEQRRQGVADHGAAPVADVERPRRVGGDELHVDGLAAAHRRIAVGRAGPQNLGQPGVPECVL